jgi:hypothetical protein
MSAGCVRGSRGAGITWLDVLPPDAGSQLRILHRHVVPQLEVVDDALVTAAP